MTRWSDSIDIPSLSEKNRRAWADQGARRAEVLQANIKRIGQYASGITASPAATRAVTTSGGVESRHAPDLRETSRAPDLPQAETTRQGAPLASLAGVAPGPLTLNASDAGIPAAPPPRAGARPVVAAPSKYRNKPTNGYASIREAKRAFQLKLMQEAGQIRNLREQTAWLLIPKQEGERACSYRSDFDYEEFAGGEWRLAVEDVKGMRTDVYKIKRKLMLMVHGIRIRET